ncbi:hypothetical protein ABPG77_008743 [Micractinium sp. CCAP 211/92]
MRNGHDALLAGACALATVTLILLLLGGRGGRRRNPALPHCQPAPRAPAGSAANEGAELARLRQAYITAVRDSLTGVHLQTPAVVPGAGSELQQEPFAAEQRSGGLDWPLYGATMVGTTRLNNLQELLTSVLQENVPGSFVECGVWRGGASVFAKAVLSAHGSDREVHLVDSFQGLPPNTTAQDKHDWYEMEYLRVSQDQVADVFQRYGLLDGQVHFHKGYFRYALPAWKAQGGVGPIAVLRMDGDMFESTMDQLYNLYDAVSPGGYIIIDDYTIPECHRAVHEFLERHGLQHRITQVDYVGAWLRKDKEEPPVDQSWYQTFNASRAAEHA